jgi:D-alanyl-D-alanine carboxypeptidase
VQTQKYSCMAISSKENDDSLRNFTWENTNKLLSESGFLGMKTGQTLTAGYCLCVYYDPKESQDCDASQ